MQIFRKATNSKKVETTEQAVYLHGKNGLYMLLLFNVPVEAPVIYERLINRIQLFENVISSVIIRKGEIKLLAIFKGRNRNEVIEQGRRYKASLLATSNLVKQELGYEIIDYLFGNHELLQKGRVIKEKDQDQDQDLLFIYDYQDERSLQELLEDMITLGEQIRITMLMVNKQKKIGILLCFQKQNDKREQKRSHYQNMITDYTGIKLISVKGQKKNYGGNIILGISPFLLDNTDGKLNQRVIAILSLLQKRRVKDKRKIEPFPIVESNVKKKRDKTRLDNTDIFLTIKEYKQEKRNRIEQIKEHILSKLINEKYDVLPNNKFFEFCVKKNNTLFAFDFIEQITEDIINYYTSLREKINEKDIQIILIYERDETKKINVSSDETIAFLHYKQVIEQIKN